MGVETADLGRVITAKGIKIGYLSQDSDELTSGRQNALYIDAHQKLEQRIKKLEAEMAHPDTLASPKSLTMSCGCMKEPFMNMKPWMDTL